MSHLSRDMEKARANCPRHTRATQLLREALARAGKPISVYKLALATGLKPERIRATLSQLISRTGGIVSMPGPKGHRLYDLYRAPKPQAGSGQIAGPIIYPQYRYGGTRLG